MVKKGAASNFRQPNILRFRPDRITEATMTDISDSSAEIEISDAMAMKPGDWGRG